MSGFPGTQEYVNFAFSIKGIGYFMAGRYYDIYTVVRETEESWNYDPVTNYWSRSVPFIGLSEEGINSSPYSFVLGEKAYVGKCGGSSALSNYFFEFIP